MPLRDDFWKVRKAGFSLLMAMVGDAKPIAFVEDTAVQPGPAARVLRPLRGDRRAARRRGPRATATPTSAACTSGRSSTSRPPKAWQTLRSIAREVSDLVVEFGGSMSGEHGDGLARSVWNRKLFGPEVYAALQAGQARPSTRTTASIPTRSSATPTRATTCGSARTTTRTSRPRRSSTSPARGASPAPSRCATASAPAARRRPARCAPATWPRATRCTRPAAGPTPCAWL